MNLLHHMNDPTHYKPRFEMTNGIRGQVVTPCGHILIDDLMLNRHHEILENMSTKYLEYLIQNKITLDGTQYDD